MKKSEQCKENARKKEVEIIVAGTPHQWPKREISYEEVVALEIPSYTPASQIVYSVGYERGKGRKPEGTLSPGASIKVKEGMVFHVSETDQS